MTYQRHYDMAIVGGGPAGLSAARTAARLGYSTVVVERLGTPGDLAHPCHAIVVPAPDGVYGRSLLGGLFFPEIDLWIPEDLILVPQALRRCYSPAGNPFLTVFAEDPDHNRAAVIDKTGLLQLMAGQAASVGAELRYGTHATGFLYDFDTVAGLTTSDGDILADIVIAAEGSTGYLCSQAGLYPGVRFEGPYTFAITMELEAPGVGPEHLGEVVTLGTCAPRKQEGMVSVLMPAPGSARVSFVSLVDVLSCAAPEPAEAFLEEYERDRRVGSLLEGARVLRTSTYAAPLMNAPASIVRNGFLATGDAVAPSGSMGILPAVYLGRRAALAAAGALDYGDTSATALFSYDALFREDILPDLLAEADCTRAVLSMADAELDRLSVVLNGLQLRPPFLGSKPNIHWRTVEWLAQQIPMSRHDFELIQRVLRLCDREEPVSSLRAGQAYPHGLYASQEVIHDQDVV